MPLFPRLRFDQLQGVYKISRVITKTGCAHRKPTTFAISNTKWPLYIRNLFKLV